MHALRSHRLVILGGAALWAACGASPTEEEYDDAAEQLAALTADDDGGERVLLEGALTIGRGGMPADLTVAASGVIRGQRGELSLRAEVSCEDAAGAALERCGPGTDRATYDLELAGSVELPRRSAELEREIHWELTGLGGEVTTVEGDSSLTLEREHDVRAGAEARWSALRAQAEYRDVRVRNADRAMIGGVIAWALELESGTRSDGDLTTERAIAIDALLELQAEGGAILTLDGVRRYHVDLRSGAMTPMSPRPAD